jgi:Tfp pilus assembly protein PilX
MINASLRLGTIDHECLGARRKQRGATLITGLVLLTLMMLAVSVSLVMSNNNLQSVGNMQSRAQAHAAAEVALETVISTDTIFKTPVAVNVGPDQHGVSVAIDAPTCVMSVPVNVNISADTAPNIYQQGVTLLAGSGFVETNWNLRAVATNADTGVVVESNQGIKIVLPADPNPCPP